MTWSASNELFHILDNKCVCVPRHMSFSLHTLQPCQTPPHILSPRVHIENDRIWVTISFCWRLFWKMWEMFVIPFYILISANFSGCVCVCARAHVCVCCISRGHFFIILVTWYIGIFSTFTYIYACSRYIARKHTVSNACFDSLQHATFTYVRGLRING